MKLIKPKQGEIEDTLGTFRNKLPIELVEKLQDRTYKSEESGIFYFLANSGTAYTCYAIVNGDILYQKLTGLKNGLECLADGTLPKETAEPMVERNRKAIISQIDELSEGLGTKNIVLIDIAKENLDGLLERIDVLKSAAKNKDYTKVSKASQVFGNFYIKNKNLSPEDNEEDAKKLMDLLENV